MNPGRIITRTGLIQALYERAPSRSCQRAIEAGRVRVLGGFRKVSPSCDWPGWICYIQSIHGRVWLLGLTVDETEHEYRCIRILRVPWDQWVGKIEGSYGMFKGELIGEWNVYNGDDPHLCACNSGIDCHGEVGVSTIGPDSEEG